MDPLVTPILLRLAGDDPLGRDAELDPPDRQPRQSTHPGPPTPGEAKGGPLSERIACGNPSSLKAASKIGRTFSSSGRATA